LRETSLAEVKKSENNFVSLKLPFGTGLEPRKPGPKSPGSYFVAVVKFI